MNFNYKNKKITREESIEAALMEGIGLKMNIDKLKILDKYKNEDDKLLVSKLFDKIQSVDKYNKVQTTDFLTPVELKVLEKVLQYIHFNRYYIFGGCENADRNSIVVYPEKLEEVFQNNYFNFNTIFNCVRITNSEMYEHRVYLSGLIKLGIKREKIGDIIVTKSGADIIVDKDVSKFLLSNLQQLGRFRNSEVELISLNEVEKKEQNFIEMKIIVSSLRLDNIVAELAKTSRNKAIEYLNQERVFVNYTVQIKPTKQVEENNVITIRGKGKFIVESLDGNTRSGRTVLKIKKFN